MMPEDHRRIKGKDCADLKSLKETEVADKDLERDTRQPRLSVSNQVQVLSASTQSLLCGVKGRAAHEG
ncbi:MAG: hypothetical protein C4293_08170 [Nitrospiraceae bacterium]